jgi:purine-binding chemotaxis protein CheW
MNALVPGTSTGEAHADAPVARQYLTFQLGGEVYAIAIEDIREIIEFGALTTVPLMPDSIRGVINLRGRVVPVIDLASRFGRARSEITRRSCIVILDVVAPEARGAGEGPAPLVLGMVVDAVNEVLEIAAADIEPAPAFGTGIRGDFVSGMGKVAAGFVILLDAQRVLSVEEMAALDGGSREGA